MADNFSTTVVIPAYNRERSVGEAIESALNQTHEPREVIVVDDGSTDRTPEIVARYGGRVRLIRVENTGIGPSRPRNIGIAAATAPFITFLDSDDVFLPTLLERTAALIRRAPRLGMVFCMSYIACRDRGGETEPRRRDYGEILSRYAMDRVGPNDFVMRSEAAFSACCRGNYVGTATGLTVPRAVCQSIGGFDDTGALYTSNDLDFIFKIVRQHEVGYLADPLCIYYKHDGNISGANLVEGMRDYHYLNHIKVLSRQLERARAAGDRRVLRGRIGATLLELGYHYRKARAYGPSFSSYARSLRWSGFTPAALAGALKVPVAWMIDRFGAAPRPGAGPAPGV